MNNATQKYLVGDTYPPEDHILRDLAIEVETDNAGQARITAPVTPYVRNSLKSLQGGIIALLAGLAGQLTISTTRGNIWQTRDLTIHYMTPGIKVPFVTKTEVMRSDNQNALMRIEVLNRGDDNRLMAVIFNSCVQIGS